MHIVRSLPFAVGLALAAGCEQSTGPAEDPPPPPAPPVIRSFAPVKSPLLHGESTNLVWSVDGASIAAISGIGVVTPTTDGARNIRPHETVSYTLTVSNDQGTTTATTSVEVTYPAAIFVNSVGGDDGAVGDTPATALKTLDAALQRVGGGGYIYLSAGTYRNAVTVEVAQVGIRGGLDPVTFFEDRGSALLRTTILPSAGIPLTVRNTGAAIIEMTNLTFLVPSGAGELAALVDGATVWFRSCTFDARNSTAATAVRTLGSSNVELVGCRIYGGNPAPGPLPLESRAVEIRDASSALVSHCFVDGGRAELLCSGVEVATSGTVRIGLSSIAAEITSPGGLNTSAAPIRIHAGHPFIGGNILFTRGGGRRFGVVEAAADTDPSTLYRNLFISVGNPPYDNFGSSDPLDQDDLNGLGDQTRNPLGTNPDGTDRNLLESGSGAVQAHELFPVGAINTGDFHLVSPLLSGRPNPAVNKGIPILSSQDYIGSGESSFEDIDGDQRAGVASQWDLGADEY